MSTGEERDADGRSALDVVTDRDEEFLARLLEEFADESLTMFCVFSLLERGDEMQSVPVSAIRVAHLWFVFNKINRENESFALAVNFLSTFDRELAAVGRFAVDAAAAASRGEDGARFEVARILHRMSPTRFARILRALEKDSRGQSANPVWHAVRADTVSATRIFEVLTSGRLPSSSRELPAVQRNRCEAIQFGVQCEPLIRTLLGEFVIGRCGARSVGPRDYDRGGDLGLLLDPSSGVLGASLDFCAGVSRDEDDLLVVERGAAIFEIKCRFKYLRARGNAETLRALLSEPGPDTFAAFVMDHPAPAVEFRRRGEVPTGRDFLVTYDESFRRGQKRRRCGTPPEFLRPHLKDLVERNADVSSIVFIFDVRKLSEGEETMCEIEAGHASSPITLDIVLRATFTVPVFVNPRHPYYCQALLQQYVLSQYYINAHRDPERMSPDELPSVHLVSAILRKRDEDERGCVVRIAGRPTDCDQIPLCLIVTPIRLDPLFTRNAVDSVLNVWEKEFVKKTGLPLWVQSAVNAYAAASTPAPMTP